MANLFQGISHANLYSQFRPTPPAEVIARIIRYVKSKINRPLENAVDIGCGTGQSTLVLAPHFMQVIGFDASEAQIKYAIESRSASNVQYRTSLAESLDVPDSSVDLATACQAFHWFDFPKVFSELDRVLVPNGVFAAYGHWIPLPAIEDPAKTEMLREVIIDHFFRGQLGKFWSPGLKVFESRYNDVAFPFDDCVRDDTVIRRSSSSVSDYIGYLSTWSPYQAFLKENPDEAQSALEDVKKKIMDTVEAKSTPEETNLNLCTEYFLLMGSKKGTS